MNDAAKQAADYAKQAADHANLAAYKAAYPFHVFNGEPISVEQEVAYAKQAAANAKQAAAEAEAQAEITSAVTKLENERDEAIAKLKQKYAPSVSDYESKTAALEQKAKDLEIIKSSILVTNYNVKPGPNYRVVKGQTYDITHSELWKNALEVAAFQSHPNANFRLVTYLARIETVAADKIRCGVYAQAHWPPVANGEVESEDLVQEIVIYHYPDAESMISGQILGDCQCMRVANYISGGVSLIALDCGVQATKRVTEVVPGNPDAAMLKSIEDNQNQLSAVKLKLSQVERDFEKEREPIVTSFAVKIADVPDRLAKQAKEKEDAKKQAVVDKVVKYNQDLADKGDAYGLLRMGERYRDGDGVPKDLTKARDYLTKAAAAGSPTAADDLKQLPTNQN